MDSDSADFNQFLYRTVTFQSMSSQMQGSKTSQVDSQFFQIDQTSGQIYTTRRFNREEKSMYEFAVKAVSVHDTRSVLISLQACKARCLFPKPFIH